MSKRKLFSSAVLALLVVVGIVTYISPVSFPDANLLHSQPEYQAEDNAICKEKGHNPKASRFTRCLEERIRYRVCLAKNRQEIERYTNDNSCTEQAQVHFPESLTQYQEKHYLIRYEYAENISPNEEYTITIQDAPAYSVADRQTMQEDFITLCKSKQQQLKESVVKTQPNCEHILHLSE